jgi:hypothetical protein
MRVGVWARVCSHEGWRITCLLLATDSVTSTNALLDVVRFLFEHVFIDPQAQAHRKQTPFGLCMTNTPCLSTSLSSYSLGTYTDNIIFNFTELRGTCCSSCHTHILSSYKSMGLGQPERPLCRLKVVWRESYFIETRFNTYLNAIRTIHIHLLSFPFRSDRLTLAYFRRPIRVCSQQEESTIGDLDIMLPWEYGTLIGPHNLKSSCCSYEIWRPDHVSIKIILQ